MAKRTPLYDWHVAHGGRMVDFAGWDMPVQYTSIVEEHQAVRNEAGLFDISHMGRLTFQGPDALDLLQRIYTNDPASMKVGQARYGLICNEAGGIRDDVLLYRFEPYWLLVVNASNRGKIIEWIEQQRGSRKVQVQDKTEEWGMVAVQGPRAIQVMEAVLALEKWAVAGRAALPVKMKYYTAQWPLLQDPCGTPMILSRTGYTGEDGYEVIIPASRLPAFVASLTGPVAHEAHVSVRLCGLGARDTLRLEAAMPLYGHELSEEIDPIQAGLGWAVKIDKGDFIGRAALSRQREEGTRRLRVGLDIDGKRIAREGAVVNAGGQEVGKVTSGTFSPTLQKCIAMAYVEPDHGRPGQSCAVDIRGKAAPGRVVPLPFFKRRS